MFSYHGIICPHLGHLDRGWMSDSSLGNRMMHTFRKLPIISPTTPASTSTRVSGATPDLVQNDPGGHTHVEGFRPARQENPDPLGGERGELRPHCLTFCCNNQDQTLMSW